MGGTIPRSPARGRGDNADMSPLIVEQLDLTERSTASELLLIQQAAYRVEAELVGFDGIPPLHETLDELIARPLAWLGIRAHDGSVAAALAYTETPGHIDIDRLVVAPAHFRKGMASALVSSLDPGVRITVSTGTLNTPAHRLYEVHGFRRTRDEMIAPGLSITHFAKEGPT